MRNRTRSRELALQILYQIDVRGEELRDEHEELYLELEEPEDIINFARVLVEGVLQSRELTDETITGVAEHWHIKRMAVIDRNILRLAVHEMTSRPDIPSKVSINEAIELGKKFSTEQSGGFINGILDRILRQIEEQDAE